MSSPELSADELTLPVKRVTGDTLEDRMTANAYHNILPARYLQKDASGELTETQTDLFERIGKNIALAEVVYETESPITATPDQLKPDHPRRDELTAEVFGENTDVDGEETVELTEENINKFAYDTIVPELSGDVREHVEQVEAEFQDLMEHLSFMPNSPTLMNAGDELQQLSACFVDSPGDDLTDIHQTAKEAAEVFQCLTDDSTVMVEDRGHVSVSEVETGDRIVQKTESGFQYKSVEETHIYEDADTLTVTLENGLSIRGTPNHRIEVDGEWTRLDEIKAGQEIQYALGWLRDAERESPVLESVSSDTLPPNGSGGRKLGSTSFEKSVAIDLHRAGHTESEIADELGVSQATVGQFRAREQLNPNGTPVKAVQQPEILTADLAELVGLWVGDGSWHQDGVRFHVGRDSVAEYINQLSRQLFGTAASSSFADGCYEVTINSHEVKRWWEANFDCKTDGAQSARVPQAVKNAPANVVEAFLRGYFTADGTLLNDTYPKLYSSSDRIIDDVATLLLGLGYPVKKSVIRDEDAHPYYGLIPTTGSGRKAFLREIGFIDERREIGLSNIESVTPRDSYAINEDYSVAVTSVVESEPTTVYDITVADNHEYVTDGIVSHNSGGGMGYAFWKLRPYGDAVGSTGGIASGPLTFMETFDQMCETIAQGGTRRGAQMAVMRVSHPDVIEFIHAKNKDVSLAHTLRLNDPDDYTYTSFNEALEEARELIDEDGKVPKHLRNAVEGHLSNFNISVGVTDGFMEALYEGEEFTFTNPRTEEPHVATEETKEMYARYGLGEYVTPGEILTIPADVLWERVVDGAHENGEPGVIYLERVNKEHSFDVEEHPEHRILATNPCVTGEMEVQLADGSTKSIGELAEEGGRVRVRTLADGKVTTKAATAFKTKTGAEIVRITTDSGVEVRVTPDHKIRTAEGEWVEATDISVGDAIVSLAAARATPQGPVQESSTQTVASVDPDGFADVYDLSVDETHNFFASASGGASINVHNCGEQPLEEYEACNLGHINLSTLAAENAPDWRVWSDEHDYETLEEGVNQFLTAALDNEEFEYRIEMGTRFLENVVTMSDFPVEEITKKVSEMRKIGLGVMGLAQLYIQLGVEYGSEVGNEIARQLMTQIDHGSKATSHDLAEVRGNFDEWGASKYANPTEYADWFEHHTGESAEDWADGYAIRNHNTTTIAPTGTTSMVGNTTGGCEPIYNVAYYKNVSDDVQGDEMLVEFDDYFLRTLEANDIDVTTVKEEAQEQMASNEFDGVEGLETVPNAIGELFVVTADLTGKEHAAVQCACQQGVDSAISKTCNFPNDASAADMDEVYRYIYDHGGKGVTVYRDGTRSKQVLTTRADNAEFSEMDEDEAAEAMVETIQETFGGIEGFLDSEEVQTTFGEELREIFEHGEDAFESGEDSFTGSYAEKQSRPDLLHGVTQRVDTGYGKLYVTINEDPEVERPFELFANTGNSGGFTGSFTEALAKTISVALRSGVDPAEIADKLKGIRSPKVAWDKGEQVNSIPDAFGTALRRYLDGDVDRAAYPQQKRLSEIGEQPTDADSDERAETDSNANTNHKADGGPTQVDSSDSGAVPEPDIPATSDSSEDATQSLIDAGESPECPDCGSMSLYFSEGCKTCESCGWSEC